MVTPFARAACSKGASAGTPDWNDQVLFERSIFPWPPIPVSRPQFGVEQWLANFRFRAARPSHHVRAPRGAERAQ